jgi:hypothetical protein
LFLIVQALVAEMLVPGLTLRLHEVLSLVLAKVGLDGLLTRGLASGKIKELMCRSWLVPPKLMDEGPIESASRLLSGFW